MEYAPPLTAAIEQGLRDYPQEDVVDGCTAAAHIAYACSDAAFIYPITPSSAMAEIYEVWSAHGRKNIFGQTCAVRQLQSEAGAAGAVHGSLSVGAVTTTFTASQGLLLMIPPMYKIAGELIPCVFHVSARAVAGQALSIFGDHSDVMAVRQCGWALLSSASVQEAQDLAMIAHMATLITKVPFVHFFDGFRTSHELQKISIMDYMSVRDLIDFQAVEQFRHRSLNPTRPYTKGTAQGPEVYFQNVEVANKFYVKTPDVVEQCMDVFAKAVGRQYSLFEYFGSKQATDVIVILGAGGPVIHEVINYLSERGDNTLGLISVKLFRPWKLNRFLEALPKTLKRVCVLDRTKEPGAFGDPLFLDVASSMQAGGLGNCKCVGGRYGLGSKDFTPAMVMAVIANLRSENPKHGFVVGIDDDLTQTSLPFRQISLTTVPSGTTECMFWGMGSDGTVGANKNVIKIIGTNTALQVQGYFAYSAHKAGGITVSHLRFGPSAIRSQYLLQEADYVAVHRCQYVHKYDVGSYLKENGIFVLNASWTAAELEKELPPNLRRTLAQKKAKLFLIDANKVAVENGMGRRINNVLMTSFFKLSGVLPFAEAIALFKNAIHKTYGKKGMHIVEANWKCVDAAVDATRQVHFDREAWLHCPDEGPDKVWINSAALPSPPTFVQGVMLALERMEGDALPTSAFEEFAGGVVPPGTAGYEKRAIALNVPIVDMDKCTQCNQCAFVCPHAAIRPFLIDEDEAENAPPDFIMKKCKAPSAITQFKYRIQVSPYDCTGCELCYLACPDEALKMVALEEAEKAEEPNWEFAINLKERCDLLDDDTRSTLKGSQFFTPMVEFSGACEGCGETPYVKLLTQLFGERLIIANATGCSSIWGASYPANAYTTNQKGEGPAWGNSLFEDNAEYGYGMAIATSHRRDKLREHVQAALETEDCVAAMSVGLRAGLSQWLLNWLDASVCAKSYEAVKDLLVAESGRHPMIRAISSDRDLLPRISQWIVGGDGWAYDIGFGGLDHVVASGVDVNFLVLDTEVYSNTGGQTSKATTMGAVHKFATGGRLRNKKDLGAICMEYGDVYVASCASSANMTQTVRAFVEAEAYHGPSLILAYSPCIEHQYIKPFNLQIEHCKLAVDSGYWPLYRYNPALIDKNENPFQLDSRKLKADLVDLLKKENRFGTLRRMDPKLATELERRLRDWAVERFAKYQLKALGAQAFAANSDKQDIDWNVLYGSETGNAEEVAKRIALQLRERDVKTAVHQLDEITLDDVQAMRKVLLVCSTAGQGEFPFNAKEFHSVLEKESNTNLFNGMTFCVMGLGDSSYVFFNSAAKSFDSEFARLGATRLLPCGLGDDSHEEGYETVLAEWLGAFWVEAKIAEPANLPTTPAEPMYKIVPVAEETAYKQAQHEGSVVVRLIVNERMTPKDYEVDVRHLEFDLSGTNLRYSLGDSLAIYPQNDPERVEEFLQYFGFKGDDVISVIPAVANKDAKRSALFKNPISVRQLFEECLDIFGKPTRSFYERFWKYCRDESEKATARQTLQKENRDVLLQWSQQEKVSYFDVMKKFPSMKPSLDIPALIDLVPLIKVRYYSIASSQKFVGTNRLHLCVGVVEWDNSLGQHFLGQCTGYLSRSAASPEKPLPICAALKATAFNLPPSDMHPVVVAGMGTGLAPFRAFIQHKAWLKAQGKPSGPLTVYFGCRYAAKDFLYGDELQALHKDGVITDLKCAFSRDQKQKFYIQHAVLQDPKLLYERLVTQDGYFYLCGSAKQVPIDIRNAVNSVLCSQGNMDAKAADDLITKWQLKGKYNVEAWS